MTTSRYNLAPLNAEQKQCQLEFLTRHPAPTFDFSESHPASRIALKRPVL
jgi:hypothetical protein